LSAIITTAATLARTVGEQEFGPLVLGARIDSSAFNSGDGGTVIVRTPSTFTAPVPARHRVRPAGPLPALTRACNLSGPWRDV
jgi:hypothetical protein